MDPITTILTGLAVRAISGTTNLFWNWLQGYRRTTGQVPRDLAIDLLYLAPERTIGTSIVRGFPPSDVVLAFDPFSVYKPPTELEKHRHFLVQKYKSEHAGKVINDLPRYRIKHNTEPPYYDFRPERNALSEDGQFYVNGQRNMFTDYLVTNESLNVVLPDCNTKVIDMLGANREQALASAASHLAINVMLFTADDYLVVPQRGFQNAENPGEYGPSLSGSIPIKETVFYSNKKANAGLIEPLPDGFRRVSFEAAVDDMLDAELWAGLKIYDLRFIAFAVGRRLGCPAIIATACTDFKSTDDLEILGRWETKRVRLVPFERKAILNFLAERKTDGIRRVPFLEFGIRMAFYQRYGEQFLRKLPVVGQFSADRKL